MIDLILKIFSAYCSGDIKNINLHDVNNDIHRFSESNSDANAITIKNIAAAKYTTSFSI